MNRLNFTAYQAFYTMALAASEETGSIATNQPKKEENTKTKVKENTTNKEKEAEAAPKVLAAHTAMALKGMRMM